MQKKIILGISFLTLSISAMAQVNGLVKSNMGDNLPGAVVRWLGDKKATSTNSEGKFHLHTWNGTQKIVTSCVGYANDTTEITPGTNEVEITLYDNCLLLRRMT